MSKPDTPDDAFARGNALLGAGRPAEALAAYDGVLAIRPDHADAHNNRGNALLALSRADAAVASYDRALALNPAQTATHYNRGNALVALARMKEAVASYDKAIALNPGYADAHRNRGSALLVMRRLPEALASYDKALASDPAHAETHLNRANTLLLLGRLDEAAASYERALEIKPDHDFLPGTLAYTRMKLCDWTDLAGRLNKLRTAILAGKKAAVPSAALMIFDEPQLHKQAAEIYTRTRYPRSTALGDFRKGPRHDRIRIGYFCADFHNHATAYLLAELFELHDRSKFEIFGFSHGPKRDDEMRRRVSAAFGENFHEVSGRSDRAIAQLSRECGIDIAIDLNTYAQNARPAMFAEGCAPIQVSYLAYPGTMGADYIDYIIADKIVIPPAQQENFTEKVIYMPHCYQVNDSQRRIADRTFTRTELGLPEQGFVFCCFNNSYKILPATFDIWMRLLKAIDGSVLWLLEDNDTVARTLRKEAAARGVDSERLVFAGRLPLDQHLARHRLADLFLDTVPINAHTTASDALWAGLPLLTCTGTAFAGRVAASLMITVGQPELVTDSLAAYEAKALELARDPAQLAAIRQNLAANKLSTPLFDTKLFARHIEAAYTAIYERAQAGLPPQSFAVD